MNKTHIAFPSISQFRSVVKQVRMSAKHSETPLPSIQFMGTIKLHGTNAGICRPVGGSEEDIYCQSREHIINLISDNAGFATWVSENSEYLNDIFNYIDRHYPSTGVVQIFGEWCGGNIQKGVAINGLPKSFVVFAMRVSEDAESQEWFDPEEQLNALAITDIKNLYSIYDFPIYSVVIDFANPEAVQNYLAELTLGVEQNCPVAEKLWAKHGNKLHTNTVGEGIVWTAKTPTAFLQFKVKGEKHSISKVKVLVPVDPEKVASVDEFVSNTVTEARLSQGFDKFRERGLEVEAKNTGEYIKWIVTDIFKEELDVLVASGLTTKDVTSKIATIARQHFMSSIG